MFRRTLPLALALVACGPETIAMPPAELPPAVNSAPAPAPTPSPAAGAPALAYPETRRVDVRDVLHGVTVEDPYRWLEDGKAPEVRAWMTAEDSLARRELSKLPERDAIAARLKELFYLD